MDEAPGDVADLLIAGEPMRLHADRALYWPARGRLLIADLHLGKGDILRAAGIPVPTGGTGHDLARLDALLRATGSRELWVLGDFLHGRRHPRFEAAWRALLAAHPGVVASVVAGNHDRSLAPDAVGIVHLPDDVRDGPFRFRHEPVPVPDSDQAGVDQSTGHVICGHVHPVVRLPGLPGRHPALALAAHQAILPAFSAFTGGQVLEPGQSWIACADGTLAGHMDREWRAGPRR
ncbi:ligase-associated DNA damage response endonuclease PdeM [Luteimonas sp. MJ246]|uniref:ligase-associated DNA damage response endonuclease PdeM n=1 Tax=Luteimonas sp. MJ174 TaxID=3129237 RepID=UPI0031BA6344